MDFSYEEIAKYVLDYEIDGNRVVVEFQNEAGEVFDGTAIVKQTKSLQNQITKKVGRMAKSQARRHASRMVRSALGGGMLGRIGTTVVRSSASSIDTPGSKNFSEKDIQEAIAKAFKRVSRNFKANSSNKRVSSRDQRREATSRRGVERDRQESREVELDFQGYLESSPVSNLFEQDILARMMISVAQADGRISEDERNLITEILPKKMGTISDIAERGDISRVESEELDEGIKRSLLLLSWSVALVDFDLSSAESSKLNAYGSLFGLETYQSEELSKLAKYETLSGVMGPYMTKDDLYNYADGLELSRDEAERMLIKFKKSMS